MSAPLASKRSRAAWLGTIMATLALLGVYAATQPWWLALVFCLPLLLFTPGTILGRHGAAVGLCFTSMAVFTHAIWVLVAPAPGLPGTLLLVFSVVLFFTSTYFVRWRAEPAEPPEDNPESDTKSDPGG